MQVRKGDIVYVGEGERKKEKIKPTNSLMKHPLDTDMRLCNTYLVMNKDKAKSQYIHDQLMLLLLVLDPRDEFTHTHRAMIESTLNLCYSKGVIDYLERKLKKE